MIERKREIRRQIDSEKIVLKSRWPIHTLTDSHVYSDELIPNDEDPVF